MAESVLISLNRHLLRRCSLSVYGAMILPLGSHPVHTSRVCSCLASEEVTKYFFWVLSEYNLILLTKSGDASRQALDSRRFSGFLVNISRLPYTGTGYFIVSYGEQVFKSSLCMEHIYGGIDHSARNIT